jgi:hypothetical protein
MFLACAVTACLVVLAAISYGAGWVGTQLSGGGGLDGPCSSTLQEEGGSMSSRESLWPPGVTCTVRSPTDGVVRREVHEAAWVPAVVIGCLAAGIVVLLAGAIRTTLDS